MLHLIGKVVTTLFWGFMIFAILFGQGGEPSLHESMIDALQGIARDEIAQCTGVLL